MNQNVGASFGLSVIVVVFFAVALYQPDKPPPTLAANPSPRPVDAQPPTSVDPPSPPPPSPSSPSNTAPGPNAPAVTARTQVRAESEFFTGGRLAAAPEPKRPRRVEPVRAAVARPVSRRRSIPVEPRGAFTEAREGESLADVAHRVYGSADSAHALWLANRDTLDRDDGPVAAGTLLRTP